MRLFDFLHTYFGFNKRERNGILVLFSIVIILFVVKISITSFIKEGEVINIKQLSPKNKETEKSYSTYFQNKNRNKKKESTENHFFVFDPNTISEEDAIELGFPKKTASTLIKFREKGGKFFVKEDIKKLYGIKPSFYEAIKDYIIIEKKEEVQKPIIQNQKNKTDISLDLNTADSLQLVKLPKIGPYTAKKILKYRNALGGFYNTDQLNEIYGMKDSILLILISNTTIDSKNIKQIAINKATYEELKKHPYINHIIASTIVAYREKHGNYKQLDDLKNVGTIDDKKIVQLKPYFSFQ